MLGLGSAARIYPTIWDGLATDQPTGLPLTLDGAFTFLKESAWVLEDAGMAAQMAEYAVLAVLREFRDADHYVRAQRAGHWSPLRRRDRASFRVGVMGAGVLAQAVLRALVPFAFPLAA